MCRFVSSVKKYLYIPIEIKVRELPAKLLLAAEAAKRGYQVCIGRKAEIMEMATHMPKGIFLGSWAGENFAETYRELSEYGHQIAVMDEEGLVTFSDSLYARFKLADATLEQIDLFFTWGEKQSDVIREYCSPASMPTLVQSGNVRMDILHADYRGMIADEVQAIQAKYGRFILLNSSFGRGNHFKGAAKNMREQREKKIIQSDDDFEFLQSYQFLQEKMIQSYLDALPAIAEHYPEHQIIVRPHPSENFDVWRDATKDMQNVHVIAEGAVHGWLLACDVLIHHFCTTALEAYAAGVPSIAYRPHRDDAIETTLPYRASLEADNEGELIQAIGDLVFGDGAVLQKKRESEADALRYYIGNIGEQFSYQIMVDGFDGLALEDTGDISFCYLLQRRAKDVLRAFKRSLLGVSASQYVDHKFSVLTTAELRKLMDSIDGEAQKLSVLELSRFCFLIRA